MFDAQLLNSGTTIFSPWFSRDADNVLATLDVVNVGGATLGVQLFTKNSEDEGDGSIVDSGNSGITRSTPGRTTHEWAAQSPDGMKELVRYKFTVTGSSAWILFRMLPPVWFDTVTA